MDDPKPPDHISSMLEDAIKKAVEVKFACGEAVAWDLIACAHDPGFQEGDAVIEMHDLGNIGGVNMGKAVGYYKGERIGHVRAWVFSLTIDGEPIRG